jgi:Na+-transporting methylmalonyl-CoA/oxaloacetate decarboxylase gamma subunit
MPRSYSAALPIAHVVLRLLIRLNWLMGAAILALLVATVVATEWTLTALGISPTSYIPAVLPGLQAIAVLGLVAVPLYHAILKRLLAIVETVRDGDPFIAVNADRLQSIAWVLLVLQLLGMVIGGIGKAISTPEHPLHLDAGFSTSGWLAVLLTFVLARIFAEGTRMREDLEGTV